MKKLNLGCGNDIRPDFINLDFHKMAGVDVIHNLNKTPYPFKKNEFDYILAKDVLEHLESPVLVLEELYRISKNNAIIDITVPHFSSSNFPSDITHKRAFGINSLNCFLEKNQRNYYSKARFEILQRRIDFDRNFARFFWHVISKFANRYPGFYETNLAYLFQAGNLSFKLRVLK